MPSFEKQLLRVADLVAAGITTESAAEIMALLRLPALSAEELAKIRLYPEYLPKGVGSFTEEARLLHFLWDALDRSVLCPAVNFSIPFRRIIAKKLFKKCGANFTAKRNVRFNFGQNIELGDNVFFNEGVFLDSKGGISIGNNSALTEFVAVFTHNHAEHCHTERSYAPVVIEDHCIIYTRAMLLPGVTVKRQGLVGACSVVTHDVPENTLVAGAPAKPIRQRKNKSLQGEALRHIWLNPGAFNNKQD